MIAVSVLTAAFPKLTEKRLQTYQENEQQAKAGYLTAITQIFSGFFQLKIFNAFSGANRAHDEANENLYRKKLRSRRIRRILYAGAYGCGNLVVLGTWVLGLFFVARGVITLPALITFAGLMNLVAGPVQIISERYSSTIAARRSVSACLPSWTSRQMKRPAGAASRSPAWRPSRSGIFPAVEGNEKF